MADVTEAVTAEWKCPKWADCTCASEDDGCNCGESCSCGSVLVTDVVKAMTNECDKADCNCGLACVCGKDKCNCGGSAIKTRDQWIETVRAFSGESSCKCPKNDAGNCICEEACNCAGQCCQPPVSA